jgi:RNA polymerase sigma-54 factor
MIYQKLVKKQIQKILLSPQMRQSMHILQMPVLELKNLIENELETNPLLEEANYDKGPIHVNHDIENNDYRKDLRLTKPVTLQENLLRQMMLLAGSEEDVEIGAEIIGNIDDEGYLKATCEEISKALGKDMGKIEAVLGMVQGLDPLGVGARDLKECLFIQLCAKDKKDSLAWKIIENHFDSCTKKQYDRIAKALDVTVDEVKSVMTEISKLEPKPGRSYSNKSESRYIAADIQVKDIGGEYHILNNKSDLPALRVNMSYDSILKNKDSDKRTLDYIKNKIRSANFLIKCLRQRWETIYKITEFLVKEQSEAMEKGRSFLKPLTFKEVAKAIGRHESTISRAIANKYVDTPSGIFEFREFFSATLGNKKDDESKTGKSGGRTNDNYSAASIKMELKEMIKEEDKKKPLSDQALQKIFIDKGIGISRRTIAKYRNELKILPSSLRKT